MELWLDLGNMSLMGWFPILEPNLVVGHYLLKKPTGPHTARFRHLWRQLL